MVDGFTIVVRLINIVRFFNVQTPKNIKDFAIWNDNFHTFTY